MLNFNSKHLKHLGKIFLSALTLTVFTVVPYLSNYILMKQAMAASLTSAKLTISDSRAAQTAVTHEFKFTTATGGSIRHVDFTYCTAPTGICQPPTDLALTTGTGPISGLGAGSVTSPTTNQSLRYTVTTPSNIASGTAVTIPFTNITNPSGTNSSFYVRIQTLDAGNQLLDQVTVASAVLTNNSISVSANIGAAFTFTVSPVTSGSVNGNTITISDVTPNTINFGSIQSGTSSTYIAAHLLNVTTNATNGYSITVKTPNNTPLSDTSNNIDNFIGSNTSPATWSSPQGTTQNENTGFFGYTTEDTTLSGSSANRFSGNKWAGFETSPYEIAYNATAVPTGNPITVGWRLEINSSQPAGEYRGTIILVATPTY